MKDWGEILPGLLQQAGLGGDVAARIEPLTGGVSSDIVAVHLGSGRVLCAKRALPTLKVASHWEAPVERSGYEVAWLRLAGRIVPGAVPAVLAEDETNRALLMDYLAPADFVLWKSELLAGRFDSAAPRAVAAALARIHAATWDDAEVARAFPTDAMFDALRLDPYLRALARRYPELAPQIEAVISTTATTKLALVHGDVSPKNILLLRTDGHPVFLDAECAWYGDPAFDAAFCINHLLLKAVHVPSLRGALLIAASDFLTAWLAGLPVDARGAAEQRALTLLPCLLLARIDGKSPVEYLGEPQREAVRNAARPLIVTPPRALADIVRAIGFAAGRLT